ncbi:MAG: RNA-binding protein [Lachnospiraceae bacterium]|nr:RNA-binding protein [Lachnospiraceae bacterium]
MNTEKEELFFQKKLQESAQLAFQKGIMVYSDFLGLAEQNLFLNNIRSFPEITYSIYGGTADAERYCICFDGTEQVPGIRRTEPLYPEAFPIACVQITPYGPKFCDGLTHRDFLGAILHLGITRSKIGDIYIKEKSAYVFCTDTIGDFLCRELVSVKHTQVHCEICVPSDVDFSPELKDISGTVASLRLDAFLALAFQTSRSSLSVYIEGGKTFINGKLSMKPGEQLKQGDLVSVRGKGRFLVSEINHKTKKGRISVVIKKYIS